MNIPHVNNRLLKAKPDQFCYELNKVIDAVNRFSGGGTVTTEMIINGAVTSDKIANGAVTNEKLAPGAISADKVDMLSILNRTYPIGSIYASVTISSPSEMSTKFGGTWTRWGQGRVPVGVDTSDPDFATVEETGGHKTATTASGEGIVAGGPNNISVVQPYITVYLWKRIG